MHQELATENAQKAVATATKTKLDTQAEIDKLKGMVHTLSQNLQRLEQKYNLLLSERFNTGPTVKDD